MLQQKEALKIPCRGKKPTTKMPHIDFVWITHPELANPLRQKVA